MSTASKMPWEPGCAPAMWVEVQWPDWVPADVREQIEKFWNHHGGPRGYEAGMATNYADNPPFGHEGWFRSAGGDDLVHGRYVHAWNNIGRVVTDDGTVRCVVARPQPAPPPPWQPLCPPVRKRSPANVTGVTCCNDCPFMYDYCTCDHPDVLAGQHPPLDLVALGTEVIPTGCPLRDGPVIIRLKHTEAG